jgi:hypothetical protein
MRLAMLNDRPDAVYGMVVRPDGLLTSALPFEQDRVWRSDYIAASAIWRRTALLSLGGWSDEVGPAEENWELWRRLALTCGSATLVPRILVRQDFRQFATAQ